MDSLRPLILISLLGSVLITNSTRATDQTLELATIEPFNDTVLASKPYYGQEMENLGQVIRLSSLFKPKQVATRFSIFTRAGSVKDIIYNPMAKNHCYESKCHAFNLTMMAGSNFDPSKRTIVMVPGFLTDDQPGWILHSKDIWLELDDVNVIMVTWKDGNGMSTLYRGAVSNTPVVARQISSFLYYLAALHKIELNDSRFVNSIQLVGHSLGAHISGFVGKDFRGRLSRITGLDPAGPGFNKMNRLIRLDRYDAKLVTVIHSNRGKMDYLSLASGGLNSYLNSNKKDKNGKEKVKKMTEQEIMPSKEAEREQQAAEEEQNQETHFGIDEQVGDIDFYANDGREQPGCKDQLNICDHGRATHLYKFYLSQALNSRTSGENEKRLFAFGADEYDQLTTGSFFNSTCPAFLDTSETLSDKVEEDFTSCAIPIDFTNSVDDYIRELVEVYQVDMNKEHYGPKNRFFFKTLDVEPYVGEHHLLKLELDRSSSWDASCTLKGQIVMVNGNKVNVRINKGAKFVDNGKFFGFAMPFVNPIGNENSGAFESILDNIAKSSNIIMAKLAKIVPSEIKLTIGSQPDVQNSDTAAKQSVKKGSKPAGDDVKQEESTTVEPIQEDRCRINLVSTEVVPIVGSKRNLIGVYNKPKLGAYKSLTARGGWFSKFGRKKNKSGDVKTVDLIEASQTNILSALSNPTIIRKFNRLVI